MDQAEVLRIYREHPAHFVKSVFGIEPDGWQELALDAFPHHQQIALLACKGPGKLESKDNIIDTPTGRRRWGSLQVGDLVFAGDGSVTPIIAIYEQGIQKLYRVSFDDGASALVGGEHLWKVKGRTERRHGTWAVLTTEQIIARGVRIPNGEWQQKQFEIPQQGAAQYGRADLPLDPYLLGVWLGDGTRACPSYTKPYVEVEHEINRRGYQTSRHADGKNVGICGALPQFRQLNVFECGSHERFIPVEFKHASPEQRRDLLAGLMDTDGTIDPAGCMEYDTTSERLAHDVVWLARSLGGKSWIKDGIKKPFYHDDNGKRVDCRDCYRVNVCLPFNPFLAVPHKAERWHEPQARYLTRYIDRIEEAGEADCMCIAVAHPDHLYLTNDFIVTHNTTVLAWLIWNFLLTRPHCNIAVTSVSEDNARDGIWKELAKWYSKSPMLQAFFDIQKRRIVHRESPQTWFCSLRSWSKSAAANAQAESLAGLHADYLLYVIDESGSVPSSVSVAAEAAMATGIEVKFVQAGNPTRKEGPLYDAAIISRAKWFVIEITGDPEDPHRSPRVDLEWARDQIEKYGRENPWVRTNILGQFPESSLNALLGPEDVRAAMARSYSESNIAHAAKVLGVDVARFGDDASVLFPRQGLIAYRPLIYRGLDTQAGIGVVAHRWNGNWSEHENGAPKGWKPDACFIDSTGGYGAGWIDGLRALGFAPIAVHFAGRADDPRYYNKRAEMYFLMCEWVKQGGQLPHIPELIGELTETQYTFRGDKLLLEDKDQVKARIGRSPDYADSLATTFYQPVVKRSTSRRNQFKTDYDPYASIFESDRPRGMR